MIAAETEHRVHFDVLGQVIDSREGFREAASA
jgi:hypothetical protein